MSDSDWRHNDQDAMAFNFPIESWMAGPSSDLRDDDNVPTVHFSSATSNQLNTVYSWDNTIIGSGGISSGVHQDTLLVLTNNGRLPKPSRRLNGVPSYLSATDLREFLCSDKDSPSTGAHKHATFSQTVDSTNEGPNNRLDGMNRQLEKLENKINTIHEKIGTLSDMLLEVIKREQMAMQELNGLAGRINERS
ncbi:hypothetical protein N7492_009726 [Penicillium capsulatum]|uniref:Uncharacterized protein n=1 Tax=Penicillium capsulatum TaxID=69766 RepID=A0A9W9HQ99_9EURO|nr:hypothetical protein N7492_009726 [Penicillium capsulatum]KAJ6114192.1 hypothetical protein N7512_007637 [Penicillium capsulatum]